MFIEYIIGLELERALDFIYTSFLPNLGNLLGHTNCRWPSNLNLETSCHRAPSLFGAAYSLLTALTILKFFLVLL